MPSPVDLRIWLLSKVLGWPGRRVASEVGVSQPTVVRKLAEMEENPPTDQELQDFVKVSDTSPKGFPALKRQRERGETTLLMLALTGAVVLISIAVAVVLIALAVAVLSH